MCRCPIILTSPMQAYIQRILAIDTLRQVTTLVAVVGAFLVNVLSNVRPLNGLSIGEISNQLFQEVQVIPANYAFIIWGLIYLGLIALAIYQALPSQRQNLRLQQVAYPLAIASVAQIVWVVLFQNRLFLMSILAIVAILLALVVAYLRLRRLPGRPSRRDYWLVQLPITIYLAWISVATIVNVASGLYSLGWDGWGISPELWSVLVLGVGTVIAATVTNLYADAPFALVLVWALGAIAQRQADNPLLAAAAAGMAIALVLQVLVQEFGVLGTVQDRSS